PLGGNIPAGGTANLTVAYDATANLPAGTYTGSFIIQTPGGVPTATTVPVTLTVSTSPLLSASPSTLNFTYQVATAVPTAQHVTLNSTNGAAALTMVASAPWITVQPTGTAGVAFPIGINPSGLAAGTYTGTVSVASAGAANSPLVITVNLKVTNDPVI